jgi:glycosyltransferase involved in cell wall biosynthesis
MFNEEESIGHALACAIDALNRHCGEDWEIVVVDDASEDRSAAIVEREIEAEPRIRLLRHPVNRRLGATLKTGFAAVRKDVVLYMDADLPFDPEAIGPALQACGWRGPT